MGVTGTHEIPPHPPSDLVNVFTVGATARHIQFIVSGDRNVSEKPVMPRPT